MRITSDILNRGFRYVETLVNQFQGRSTMTSDQTAGKVLYDLEVKFDETPELELVSILALAVTFAEQTETVDFLRNEFQSILDDCYENGGEVVLDLQPHEKALFDLFLNKPFDTFQKQVAV